MKKKTWCILNTIFNPTLEGWYAQCYCPKENVTIFGLNFLGIATNIIIYIIIYILIFSILGVF